MHRLTAALVCALLAITGLTTATSSSAAAATTVTKRLYRAIDQLSLARETRAGYDRAKFRHWVDADGDAGIALILEGVRARTPRQPGT